MVVDWRYYYSNVFIKKIPVFDVSSVAWVTNYDEVLWRSLFKGDYFCVICAIVDIMDSLIHFSVL